MAEFLISHYEDEPSKVDFPGLIEVGLFKRSDVSGTNIEEIGGDGQTFIIDFTFNKTSAQLTYLIGLDLAEIGKRSGKAPQESLLHLVDMSIGADTQAGVSIVTKLSASGVANEKIWVVTAYESDARKKLPETIKVYPKPSPFSAITESIIDLLLEAVEKGT